MNTSEKLAVARAKIRLLQKTVDNLNEALSREKRCNALYTEWLTGEERKASEAAKQACKLDQSRLEAIYLLQGQLKDREV